MTTGHRLFCKEFLCFNTMPWRHMPLLVHFRRLLGQRVRRPSRFPGGFPRISRDTLRGSRALWIVCIVRAYLFNSIIIVYVFKHLTFIKLIIRMLVCGRLRGDARHQGSSAMASQINHVEIPSSFGVTISATSAEPTLLGNLIFETSNDIHRSPMQCGEAGAPGPISR